MRCFVRRWARRKASTAAGLEDLVDVVLPGAAIEVVDDRSRDEDEMGEFVIYTGRRLRITDDPDFGLIVRDDEELLELLPGMEAADHGRS